MKPPALKSKPKKKRQLSPERRRFIVCNVWRILHGIPVLKWAEWKKRK